MHDSPAQTLLVVLERGASWPDCVEVGRLGGSDTVFLVQGEQETHAEFAERTRRRLVALTAGGRNLDAAAIATAETSVETGDIWAARSAMADAVLSTLRQPSGSGKRLWLVAPVAASRATRHQLFTLAGIFTSELRDPGLTISVRFPGSTETERPRGATEATLDKRQHAPIQPN